MTTALNGTVIYRELGEPPAILLKWLDERNQLYNVVDDHQKEHLYVDNDIPRDVDITPMIVQHTIGFSLFTEQGKRISDYSRLDKAIRAQAGAELRVVPEVELEDEIDLTPPDVFEDSNSAIQDAMARRIAELEGQVAAATALPEPETEVEAEPESE